MADPLAELSSIASALEELSGRVAAIADTCRTDRRDELATQLDEVERSLAAANRRLAKLLRG